MTILGLVLLCFAPLPAHPYLPHPVMVLLRIAFFVTGLPSSLVRVVRKSRQLFVVAESVNRTVIRICFIFLAFHRPEFQFVGKSGPAGPLQFVGPSPLIATL